MDGNVQFTGSPMGDCEAYDERTAHVTVVRVLADLTSKLIGSATIEATQIGLSRPRSDDDD